MKSDHQNLTLLHDKVKWMLWKSKDEEEFKFHTENKYSFMDYLNVMIGILEHCILDVPNAWLLQKLLECMEKVKQAKNSKKLWGGFFMFITNDFDENKWKSQRKLGFWCFNPSYAFHNFLQEKPRSVILASGTLSPMNIFQTELQIDFSVKLENDHVIS